MQNSIFFFISFIAINSHNFIVISLFIHTHTHTHSQIHIHTLTHMYIHTYTHTHIHNTLYIWMILQNWICSLTLVMVIIINVPFAWKVYEIVDDNSFLALLLPVIRCFCTFRMHSHVHARAHMCMCIHTILYIEMFNLQNFQRLLFEHLLDRCLFYNINCACLMMMIIIIIIIIIITTTTTATTLLLIFHYKPVSTHNNCPLIWGSTSS